MAVPSWRDNDPEYKVTVTFWEEAETEAEAIEKFREHVQKTDASSFEVKLEK